MDILQGPSVCTWARLLVRPKLLSVGRKTTEVKWSSPRFSSWAYVARSWPQTPGFGSMQFPHQNIIPIPSFHTSPFGRKELHVPYFRWASDCSEILLLGWFFILSSPFPTTYIGLEMNACFIQWTLTQYLLHYFNDPVVSNPSTWLSFTWIMSHLVTPPLFWLLSSFLPFPHYSPDSACTLLAPVLSPRSPAEEHR